MWFSVNMKTPTLDLTVLLWINFSFYPLFSFIVCAVSNVVFIFRIWSYLMISFAWMSVCVFFCFCYSVGVRSFVYVTVFVVCSSVSVTVWGYGLLFVTVINLLSVLAVLLLPLIGQKRFDSLMPSMIGLAAGSLAATALFYLIPDVSARQSSRCIISSRISATADLRAYLFPVFLMNCPLVILLTSSIRPSM